MTAANVPATPTRIPSLHQHAAAEWQRMREEYGVTLTEVRELYPVSSFEASWFSDLLRTVEAGVKPSGKLYRSLTDHQRLHVLRTRRALSDDAFTRELVALGRPR